MTQDASELTSGATEAAGPSATPVAGEGTRVLATVVRGTVEFAVAVGVGRDALLAFLLGYSETSSFHRAFRRWTSMGPQEFRATRVGS